MRQGWPTLDDVKAAPVRRLIHWNNTLGLARTDAERRVIAAILHRIRIAPPSERLDAERIR